MPDVHIEHVIFTRVEKTYSPHGYSGYQIVYQSPTLSAAEAAQIEKSVQCFLTNKQQINRYQFFWTAQGQAVLTKSVSLPAPDQEVIDRNQRDAFLTHALVVSQEQFARVRNDPFAIFEAAENMHLLAENVAQLVSYLDLKNRPPEQIDVPIRKQVATLLDGWSKDEIQQLYDLGEAAAALNEQKKSILMIAANPAEIFSLLSCLLILLPPAARVACTFDTFVDNCIPSAGNFWTIGSTKAINNNSLVPMRLAERQIAPIKQNNDGSAYSAWFSYALQKSEIAQLNEELYSAQVVDEAFKTQKALPDEPLNERALHVFHHVNKQAIDVRLYNALAAVVDKHIAEAIVPSLDARLPLPAVLSIAAQGTCNNYMLAKIIYRWLINEQPEWKGWEDVLKFAAQARYAPLLLLASVKARSLWPFMGYEKLRLQAVRDLWASGELSGVLDNLSGGIRQVPDLQVPGNDAPFRRFVLSDEEFQMVVDALLQQNAGDLLQGSCVQRVEALQNRKIVLGLTKAVAASTNVAPEFVQALRHHPLYSG